MSKGPVIALDGPAGAGKSTVAKAIAERLGFLYLDTGAMYRAITYAFVQSDIQIDDGEVVNEFLKSLNLQLIKQNNQVLILLDGRQVEQEIRSPLITELVPKVASIPAVREYLVSLQRSLASEGNIVVDGRDIGTYVFPQADCKIYLSASEEERAKRRWHQLRRKDQEITISQVLEDLKKRDHLDRNRSFAPLRQAEDAKLVDTTGRDIQSVVEEIISLCRLQIL